MNSKRSFYCGPLAALALSMCSPFCPAYAQRPALDDIPSGADAPIVLLVDITSGQVLFSRNAHRRFVPASITKTMTTFVAFERISEGALDPAQTIRVPKDVSEEWYGRGSSMLLPPDAEVPISDLLAGIATVSANDGSLVLAQGLAGSVPAWLGEMNRAAHALGMTNTHFGSPNGWPDDGYTFTTAYDLALLAAAITDRHPQLYSEYIGRRDFTYNDLTQINRDPLLGRVVGADGIKTGFTSEAGFGFLGSAERNGQRLVLVLAGVNRNALRARLARRLMEWGFESFERKKLLSEAVPVGSASVQDGSASTITLVTDRAVYVNIPQGRTDGVRYKITYDGPLRAPIAAGDTVARLEIDVPGMEPAIVPLLAQDDVKKAGIVQRILNGIAGWFR